MVFPFAWPGSFNHVVVHDAGGKVETFTASGTRDLSIEYASFDSTFCPLLLWKTVGNKLCSKRGQVFPEFKRFVGCRFKLFDKVDLRWRNITIITTCQMEFTSQSQYAGM
jgi:hypothetical protein